MNDTRRIPPPPNDPSQVFADRDALRAFAVELRTLKAKVDLASAAARRLEQAAIGDPGMGKASAVVDLLVDFETDRQATRLAIEALDEP